MRPRNISYEELDPDNQDRSSDYYLGVMDATRYFEWIFSDMTRSLHIEHPAIAEVKRLVDLLSCTCEERRFGFFLDHMGAELFTPKMLRDEAWNASHKKSDAEAEHGTASD